MKLIDKDALVAEIENKIKKYTHRGEESDFLQDGNAKYWGGVLSCLNEVKTLINTLEVKEVDLDKSLTGFMSRYAYENDDEYPSAIDIAKHFFELGLKAQIAIIYKPTEKDIHKLGLKSQKEDTSECFNKDDFFRKVYEWLKGYAFADDENKVHLPTLLHDFLKDSRTM